MSDVVGSGVSAADVVKKPEPALIKDSAVSALVCSQIFSVLGSSTEMMSAIAAQCGDAELERSLDATALQMMSLSSAEISEPGPDLRQAAALMQRLAEVVLKG